MTAEEFRKIALGIPEALESAHGGHPDFRIAGKVFASLGSPDSDWGMVKLTPGEQRFFVDEAPGVFKPCNGVWGLRGYTSVHLAPAKPQVLQQALEAAAKNVAPHTTPPRGGPSRRR